MDGSNKKVSLEILANALSIPLEVKKYIEAHDSFQKTEKVKILIPIDQERETKLRRFGEKEIEE
ncbi:MAG: hypothetical protein HC836_35735 [Richelia sp. RM2_1_2]|nr:hypothetical protein [Richelia sp. RM2_1_2]